MDRVADGLLDQIETVDQHAEARQLAGPELREMRDPERDRLVGVQCRQRIAQHRGRGIRTQHDGLAVEAVNPQVLADLPDHLEHCGLAAARAEEGKQVDRSVDGPFDFVIEHQLDVCKLAFVDRAMQCARKTPEAMLCHFGLVLKLDFQSKRMAGGQRRRPARLLHIAIVASDSAE
ncbi:hypothetical protein chiPu_0025829 [Chiloscyllium punctatum]|uniref:Uncharacterized protein n=1 Tax=Chiloscyllium punctatum TaxID=137246 RepID=A0A401TG07_CHIPU|nr:hypothetical protein [Chiloscyllium punctatum]